MSNGGPGPALILEQRNQIVEFLLTHLNKKGIPKRGRISEVATLFGINRRSVSSIWAAARKLISEGKPAILTSNTVGIPRKKRVQLDLQNMKSIKFSERSTIRRLAKSLEVSKSSVGRWVKQGLIRPHTNAIKPDLTAVNKLLRLRFSLSCLQVDRLLNIIKFGSMYNVVHIDEKWFYITKATERYYMVPGEIEPYRSCKSKRFITKIMFMCAVARPQYASNGELIFDGKIGIFPFTQQVAAQRKSKNREKGTMETKAIDAITKQVIKECIISQVIPSIKSKWPSHASKNIIIQQDNAKPHINNDDADFRRVASSNGFNIKLVCQPPNSPDTNINDLGWFRAIQSLQVETKAYTVDDLVRNVIYSFEQLTDITLNNVFLSLQACLIEVMKVRGHNNYKLPHMNKSRQIREGTLPEYLEVDGILVRECIDYLRQAGNEGGSTYDINTLMSDLGY